MLRYLRYITYFIQAYAAGYPPGTAINPRSMQHYLVDYLDLTVDADKLQDLQIIACNCGLNLRVYDITKDSQYIEVRLSYSHVPKDKPFDRFKDIVTLDGLLRARKSMPENLVEPSLQYLLHARKS